MADRTDKFISASEVNKYCYCAWQWYYGRVYGAAELNRLRKERNEALGITGARGTNPDAFERGRVFHENYRRNDALRRLRRRLVIAACLAAVLCMGVWWWVHYA